VEGEGWKRRGMSEGKIATIDCKETILEQKGHFKLIR